MSVGFPQTLNDLNSQVGGQSVALREALRNVQRLKLQLDAVTDGVLLAAPYTLVQGDINTLRSAYVDMNDLALVYQGSASSHLTGTYDYRTFAKLLWGWV
jgi:hypothetical protein